MSVTFDNLPQLPQKRTFKKAKDVVKALILKHNPEANVVAFEDFEATVNTAAKTISLAISESTHDDKYVQDGPFEFNFTRATVAEVLQHAGFISTYHILQKDDVIAALPEGFTTEYAENTKTLTVKVAPQVTTFGFGADSATSVAALLSTDETFEITFIDDRIDLDVVFANRELTLAVEELFEAVTTDASS